MNINNLYNKVVCYDRRLIQEKPSYKIMKGSMSATNTTFNALTKSSSVINWNIQVPSLNVFLDREIAWTSEVVLRVVYTANDLNAGAAAGAGAVAGPPAIAANPAANTPLAFQFGSEIAPNSFPLHRLVQTSSATINDAVSTMNTNDVLNEILYLLEVDPNKKINHTCPSFMSRYAKYADGAGAMNNSLSGFYDQVGFKAKNGSWHDITFCDANGDAIVGNRVVDGVTFVGGKPTYQDGAGGTIQTVYNLHIKIRSTENLMLSPFLFNKDLDSVGLFGINNAQIQLNLKSDPSRALQFIPNKGRAGAPANPTIAVTYPANPIKSAVLNCMFLTPPLDVKLPEVSVVPYMSYPRFITNSDMPLTGKTITNNTITLPSIPDYLVVYCKKTTYANDENEFYFPITKLNIIFDNFAGILNTYTKEQLYQVSYQNGLKIDYNTFSGKAFTPNGSVQTVGSFLISEFGKDIPLQPSQASGVLGNYSLQVNATIENPTGVALAGNNDVQLVLLCPSAGYFTTQSGSSMIQQNLLTEADVLASHPVVITDASLDSKVGGGFFDGLSSSISKVIHHPAVQKIGEKILEKGADKVINKMLGSGKLSGAGVKAPSRGVSGGRKGKMRLSQLL